MRRASLVSALFLLTAPLWSQEVADSNVTGPRVVDENGHVIHLFLHKDHPAHEAKPQARAQNLSYHGGPVITKAQVVSIFWGSYWGTDASPNAQAMDLMAFFGQFGTNPEYNVITQYSGIQQNNLTNQYWVDTVNPSSAAVTDAMVQAEVIRYFGSHAIDGSTIYEVFLPPGYYAQIGSSTSCGGPHLQFCAYHSNFSYSNTDIKYASMPQPSCSGCQTAGWTATENFEHFACHETREAVTDPDGNAWFDRSGNEADDKCAWSPTPFLVGAYGYQYEWSNADSKCVPSK